jgi:hypothetical protein
MTEDRTTTAERYARAAHTSNLGMTEHRQGDADIVAAAGMVHGVGPKLLRLMQEYDSVAQDVRRVSNNDLTAMLLIMMQLRSLSETKEALYLWALDRATKRRLMLTDKQIGAIVGRSLQAFLSPTCPTCSGVGMTGGYDGKIQNICRRCNGSGRTNDGVGFDVAEREFAADLMRFMGQAYSTAEIEIKKQLA